MRLFIAAVVMIALDVLLICAVIFVLTQPAEPLKEFRLVDDPKLDDTLTAIIQKELREILDKYSMADLRENKQEFNDELAQRMKKYGILLTNSNFRVVDLTKSYAQEIADAKSNN